MAGMVNQTRTKTRRVPWHYTDSSISLKTGEYLVAQTQTTNSFRSGRSELVSPPEPIPTTQIEAIRQYRKEYKENKRRFDTGHPFTTQNQIHTMSHPRFRISGGGKNEYVGPLCVETAFGTYGTTSSRRFISLPAFDSSFYGSIAISRTAPTNPVADLAVLLGELRKEGLPKLGGATYVRERTSRARALGGEHLNVEFGWKPLVSGIVGTALAIDRADQIMTQYRRDSGKWVRRSYEFPDEVLTSFSNSRTTSQAMSNTPNTTGWNSSSPWFTNGRTGRITETVEITRKVYFSGAYTYFLPKESSHAFWRRVDGYQQKASHLLGLDITPTVLWNLQPWTWLADWDSNIGANIAAFTALQTDSLVIVYGYLMCETRAVHTYTVSGVQTHHSGTLPDFSETFTSYKKERISATPYGFGRNPSTFTGRQWSILGALGLTRSPGRMRGPRSN